MATLDFEKKQVKISAPYYITNNLEGDFKCFKKFYKNIKGKNPELS